MKNLCRARVFWSALLTLIALASPVFAQTSAATPVLDKQKLLDSQHFWDNRDWDWYQAHIPFFECPDPDITTTYYYRWELVSKHLTYGSPQSGYSFTEFIDRPFWSGAYGSISCPAGHQLYEVRWLADPRYARDYARYWFLTSGAQPRRYSCWLADAIWALHQVHPDRDLLIKLLPHLKRNYEAWEQEHFDADVGLFWQTGHDDGMEYNINSRQTRDLIRGAPGYRPTLNSYLWADARAIAHIADLAGDAPTARTYRAKADHLKANLERLLWDPERRFFFHMYRQDETRDGARIQARTLTYQTGKYAGNGHGREQIGFVPWQFGLPDAGYESAWKPLMDPNGFFAEFGPTTVERHDPLFYISPTCCYWSGQSWPYATSQTLKALANLIQDYQQQVVTRADYLRLLHIYAITHRKGPAPYIAEAANPDTGSWEGHDTPNHSEHYFHSSFNDLVITGLVGLRPRNDDTLIVQPLAPESWPYFALDRVAYRGRQVAIVWDRDGTRYGHGKGLHVLADGVPIAHADHLERLSAKLSPLDPAPRAEPPAVNFAVNNDGHYYPHLTASFSNPRTPLSKLNDGNFWYHITPPNRWTCENSPNAGDWVILDFGIPRRIHTIRLYLLDDETLLASPASFEVDSWTGSAWSPIPHQSRAPDEPTGHRANVIHFPPIETGKIRVTLVHRPHKFSGLSEIEAWGDGSQPITAAPPPAGNLAYNPGDRPFPRISASFTSRFDKVERANDGIVRFTPSPANRWTSYESPNGTDWLEIDFGARKEVGRIELAIYDDRGGVQAPADYRLEYWDGSAWRPAAHPLKSPETPTGGQYNELRFDRVQTAKVRVVFTHSGRARSGVSELLVWPD